MLSQNAAHLTNHATFVPSHKNTNPLASNPQALAVTSEIEPSVFFTAQVVIAYTSNPPINTDLRQNAGEGRLPTR